MKTLEKTETAAAVDAATLARIAREGYGPGAWHGPDLKAALVDVTPEAAYWRPAPGRHNVAEVALHHAYCVRSARAKISGEPPEPFVLKGEDWFEVPGPGTLGWPRVLEVVDREQRRLAEAVAALGPKRKPPLPAEELFELVLGVTCHAVYHAGQIQLLKRLRAG